jgi:mannose-6-phosphate isomerase-like protein (cupin superfamily)
MIGVSGANVGVGVVYRAKGQSPAGSSSHDAVTEIYQVIAGSGTLVTGGEIVDPQRRAAAGELVGQVNGPGVSGRSIRGGVSHHLSPGDMVIIPAGTPHWFSEVDEAITCTVVRVDPGRVVALK